MGTLIGIVDTAIVAFFLYKAWKGVYYKFAITLFTVIRAFAFISTIIYLIMQGKNSYITPIIMLVGAIAFPFIAKWISTLKK